jgi:hypothetical protein
MTRAMTLLGVLGAPVWLPEQIFPGGPACTELNVKRNYATTGSRSCPLLRSVGILDGLQNKKVSLQKG